MTRPGIAVGLSVPRADALDKASGRAQYTDDLARPGMLHVALVRSPHAHARIVSYDTAAARALPGVRAVITGADFKPLRVGPFVKDETIFAMGKARYVGEPVAAVAATSLAAARAAARLVEVEYATLPPVLSIDDALKPDAPLVHEDLAAYFKLKPVAARGNIVWETELAEGDVDAAFKQCDVIVEATYETPAQHHAYLETNAVLAEPEPGGRIGIWTSCQSVHQVQARVAEELGCPMTQVRAQVPRVGGGFGGKHASTIHSIAAALARATGKPVKLTLTRSDDFEIQRSRHPARIRLRTGARRDGTILAREAEILLDGGAYADESPAVLNFAVLMARGPYRIPNLRVSGRALYTNKLRAGAFRGFGNPQAGFAGESQIDELAAKLGMDPVALRLKNALTDGERWAGGHTLTTCRVADCLAAVRDAAAKAPPLPATPGVKRGLGYAVFAHVSGLLGTGANVQLKADGSLALTTGAVDIGQGSDTVLAQICAEALQVAPAQVAVSAPDSDTSPYNWKTAGSRTTYMTGRAVLAAALEAKEKILRHAADMMECAADDLELRPGGKVGLKGVPDKTVSFREIALRSLYFAGGPILGAHSFVYDGERLDPKRALMAGFAFTNLGVYTFGAQAVELEVDTATGRIAVLRGWSAHDVGRAINPAAIEGQVQGGFVQGLGYALSEEMVWDTDGRLANPSLAEYAVPGALDVPATIVPIIIEAAEPTGPFGAKGVGEPAMVGVAPAICNAVAAATGMRLRKLPLTAERVLDALDAPAPDA
jgi:CO/xanthine dehydrogenase Mo-binding subunit